MTTFRDALQSRDFALTAELNLTAAVSAEQVLEQGSVLCGAVDGVQITDNPYGQVQMSSLTAAGLLVQSGVDAIPQMSCRDRNRTALESDLLGARALGIETLVLMRGERPRAADQPQPVYDLDAKQLIALARAVGDDERPAGFHIGCMATLFKPVGTWEPDELKAKTDAGAQFVQTQLCFDMDVLRRYMNRLVAARLTWRTNVIVSLATLPSAVTARWLQQNMRGALMPDAVVGRMEESSDPENEGVKICAELLEEVREIPGVSGANLMTPGVLETIPAAIQASGIRR